MATKRVTRISIDDALDIVDHPAKCTRGLFLVKLHREEKTPWLAIDNTSGSAFCEKFRTEEEAEEWLTDGA